MDYTFRNNDGTLTQVELRDFQLTVRRDGKEHVIPHSAISHVSLGRKKTCYSIEIRSLDFGSVRICYTHSGDNESQSRQYNTFVRALHSQLLKNHSQVEFYSGFKPANVIEKISTVFLLAILTYSIEDYFNFTPLEPYKLVLLTIGLGGLLTVGSYLTNSPKNYQPTNIPLTMLPPAT